MPRRRLGVALLLPAEAAAEVDGLRRALGDPALGRIPPHLTLVPPVNVRDDELDVAHRAVRAAGAAAQPLHVTLGPPTTFLPDNPVLYLGVSGAVDAVHRVRDAVFVAPLARDLTWPFVPHVTIADDAEPARIEQSLVALADYRIDVTLTDIALLEEGERRVWLPIGIYPLGATRVIGRGAPAALELDVVRAGTTVTITAMRDHQQVGRATAHVAGTVAFLDTLDVAPDNVGDGIGTHLLAAFDSWAAEAGATTTEYL